MHLGAPAVILAVGMGAGSHQHRGGPEPGPIELDAARRLLPGTRDLLAYHLEDRASFLWFLGPGGLEMHRLPPKQEIERLVLHHNRPGWLSARLDAIDARHIVEIATLPDSESPYLSVDILTPAGNTVTLSSNA